MMLRNPQALYILKNLEKFKKSIKIHFINSFREITANFNNFQGSSTSAPEAPIDFMLHMLLPVTQSFKTA